LTNDWRKKKSGKIILTSREKNKLSDCEAVGFIIDCKVLSRNKALSQLAGMKYLPLYVSNTQNNIPAVTKQMFAKIR
jgi:hypothetical protein